MPTEYAVWWQWTERCSGHTGDFEAVSWLRSPDEQIVIGSERYAAFWFRAGNRIVVAAPYLRDGPIVRHEMLHALLARGDHPAGYFQERCAGVVGCDQSCRTP